MEFARLHSSPSRSFSGSSISASRRSLEVLPQPFDGQAGSVLLTETNKVGNCEFVAAEPPSNSNREVNRALLEVGFFKRQGKLLF